MQFINLIIKFEKFIMYCLKPLFGYLSLGKNNAIIGYQGIPNLNSDGKAYTPTFCLKHDLEDLPHKE